MTTPPAQHNDPELAPVADGAAGEAGLARIIWEMQLMGLLEAAAEYAHERYGVTCLLVDRPVDSETAQITALVGASGMFDLWDLDPMVWDEANWAAVRLLPAGDMSIVRPPTA